jgi:polyisoprenoid-binding protein YceI
MLIFASLNNLKNRKMKKLVGITLGILVITSSVFASNTKNEKAAFEIDTKESKVLWTAKKVTGEHTGYLSVGKGSVMVENSKVVGSQLSMDMNSIVCTDIKDEGTNQKFVGHLRSDDFFSVGKHPVANFEITSIKSASTNGEYQVIGKMTIKGITNEISFPAKVSLTNGLVKAVGTAKLDRTKWDIRYGSGKFFEGLGDKMIYDEFEITFDITAKAGSKELSAK